MNNQAQIKKSSQAKCKFHKRCLNIIPNNINQILQQSCKAIASPEMVFQDIAYNILQDDQNTIEFYTSPRVKYISIYLKQCEKKSSLMPLKSFSETKGYRLFEKRKRNRLEKNIMEKLRKQPGNTLLLSEIYEKLEEQFNEEDISIQDETQQILELNKWTKSNASLQNLNYKKQSDFVKKQPSPPLTLPRLNVQPEFEDCKTPKSSQQIYQDFIQNQPFQQSEKMEENLDWTTNRKVQKYKQVASNINSDDVQQLKSKNVKNNINESQIDRFFDYTFEGMERMFNILIKITTCNSQSQHEIGYLKCQKHAQFQKKQKMKNKKINNLSINKLRKIHYYGQSLMIFKKSQGRQSNWYYKYEIQIQQKQLTIEHDEASQNSLKQSKIISQKSDRGLLILSLLNTEDKKQQLENDMKNLSQSEQNFKNKQIFNQQTLQKIDLEVIAAVKANKRSHKALVQFYYFLLKNGKDFRSTGIAWIVQILIQNNQTVHDFQMPQFLDEKSKEFVLKKANYLIQIEEIQKNSNEIFKKYEVQNENSRIKTSMIYFDQSNCQDISLPSFFGNDQSKLSAIDVQQTKIQNCLKKKNIYQFQDILSITHGMDNKQSQLVEDMVTKLNLSNQQTTYDVLYQESQKKLKLSIKGNSIQPQDFSISREAVIMDYYYLTLELKRKQKKFQSYEQEEASRIIKEFDFKSYGKRFEIDPGTVLSCLFGGERADREMLKNGMARRNYLL